MSEPAVTRCLACGEPMLPGLDECFVCPAGASPPLRRAVRYRVTAIAEDAEGLAKALGSLASADPGNRSSRWFVRNPPFDVFLEGTDLQHEMFTGLLAGAKHELISLDAPALPESLRWAGRPLAWKLGVTVALGAAAAVLGTTSVIVASAGMATLLVARGVSLVPRVVVPGRMAVDSSFDLLEPRERAAYRAARSVLGERGTIQALDRLVGIVVRARAESRARAAHLRDAEARRLDGQLGRVLCDLCAALAQAPRARGADEPGSYRQAPKGEREGAASSLLTAAGRVLEQAMGTQGAGARAGILARYAART